jgi:hypothetical protein
MPYKKILFDLYLFDEGAAGTAVDSGVAAATTAENPAGIAEGEQAAPAAGDQTGEDSWESLINGKYKEQYGQAIQQAVAKRFRNYQDNQSKIDAIDPIVRTLAQRYGIEADEQGIPIDALTEAIMGDDSMYEQEAFERGMSVEDLKELKALERENSQLRRFQEQTQSQNEWNNIMAQGKQLTQMYPDFNLPAEMENPQFVSLLKTLQGSGFPDALRRTFEVIHKDEIMGGAMQYAVQRTQQQISNSIQSGMRRPQENGTSQRSAAATGGLDPSTLTKSQIDDIKRRAERGERIVF